MAKIVPLLEEGATDLERILLCSAEEDLAVAPGARERTVAVVTAAIGLPLMAKPSIVAKWIAPSLVNWLAGGVVTVALLGGALEVARRAPVTRATGVPGSHETQVRPTLPRSAMGASGPEVAPPRSPIDPALSSPVLAMPIASDSVHVRPNEVVRKSLAVDSIQRTDPPPAPPAATISEAKVPRAELAAVSGDEDSLRVEAQMLETAREQLARSHPAEALATLDRYDARVGKGALAPEAAVLRIQVLVQAGDRAGARLLADDFVRTHPASPYVARVRSLFSNHP